MLKQPLATILPAFIAVLLLLTSCDSYYKITELTTKSTAAGQEVQGDDFASNLSVWGDSRHDTVFLTASFSVRKVAAGRHLKMTGMAMTVKDYPVDNKNYTLQNIVVQKHALNSKAQYPFAEIDSAFQNGKSVVLTTGYDYFFSYYFFIKGRRHVAHKIQVSASALLDDDGVKKTASRTVVFERHHHFNPGGD